MCEEIWRNVIGYEEYYAVSSLGRVVSFDRETVNKNGMSRIEKGKERKQSPNSSGYLSLGLNKNGIKFTKTVHRIVAEAFIPNPNLLSTINHIDGNKTNNHVSNLEWMSQGDNVRHSWEIGITKPTCIGRFNEKHPMSKVVYQYSKDGHYVGEFPSVSEAARCVGAKRGNISMAALYGSVNTHVCGYKWSYEKRDKF